MDYSSCCNSVLLQEAALPVELCTWCIIVRDYLDPMTYSLVPSLGVFSAWFWTYMWQSQVETNISF